MIDPADVTFVTMDDEGCLPGGFIRFGRYGSAVWHYNTTVGFKPIGEGHGAGPFFHTPRLGYQYADTHLTPGKWGYGGP